MYSFTEWFIAITISVVVLVDIALVAAAEGGGFLTISRRIRAQAAFHAWLPFGWGVLLGHFFGPGHSWRPWWSALPLAFVGVASMVGGYFRWYKMDRRAVIVCAILGVIAGAVFWAQPEPTPEDESCVTSSPFCSSAP